MKYAVTLLLLAGTLTTGATNGEPTATAPQSCASLTSLTLPNTTITLAQATNTGAFTPPIPAGGAAAAPPAAVQAFRDLRAFCRVAATLKPSNDSDIKIEVWLPASDWNGKFQAVGNGGWTGSISYAAMADGLRRGANPVTHLAGWGVYAAQFALKDKANYIPGSKYPAIHEAVELLQERPGQDGLRTPDRGVVASVHGSRYGSLSRRRRTEYLRYGYRTRTMGRAGEAPRTDHCITHHEWKSRPHTPTVSVPASCRVQGDGQHG